MAFLPRARATLILYERGNWVVAEDCEILFGRDIVDKGLDFAVV
jgi:hypothetical protein